MKVWVSNKDVFCRKSSENYKGMSVWLLYFLLVLHHTNIIFRFDVRIGRVDKERKRK